jgi:hypothetical protein
MAVVNNRLEEFPVSILTFTWHERIYCSDCYIFEWNPDADARLPEEYTTTTNNQQFLQYDNDQNAENRMLVFYSPDSLERLANAQTLFMDGTFSAAPYPCKQLYTIRVPFKDVTVTAVYAFLPNKCQDTYRELFGG